jgi:hypothetical protein
LQETGNSPVHGHWWLVIAIAIFLMWGLQAYFMKSSAARISPEGLFVYMALTAVLLCPIALLMTNFSARINWGLSGLYLSSSLQLLNSIGALLLIYAIRWGKAIIVVPMINRLFLIAVATLLLIAGCAAKAEVPVAISAQGWTITVSAELGTLSVSQEDLGLVLQDV